MSTALVSHPYPLSGIGVGSDSDPDLFTFSVAVRLSADGGHDRLLRVLRTLVAMEDVDISTDHPSGPGLLPRQRSGAGGAAGDRAVGSPAAPTARVVLFPRRYTVAVDGRPVALSRLEYALLQYFVRNRDFALTRHQLLVGVWGHTHTGPRTVDVYVRRLRAKLGEDIPLFTTVRGIGYRLSDDAPVEIVEA